MRKECMRKNLRYLTAWGEEKSIAAWSRDPRCRVTFNQLANRVSSWPCESEVMLTATTRSYEEWQKLHELHHAWGESKTIDQWVADPRCKQAKPGILARVRNGWTLEEALATPPGAVRPCLQEHVIKLLAFGEIKTLKEWAADPRCTVSLDSIRLRLKKGWSPERAIGEPPVPAGSTLKGKVMRRKGCKEVIAWGETKLVQEWARDPRAKVPGDLIASRLRNGWTPEEAITSPSDGAALTPRKTEFLKNQSPPLTAWGETKRVAEWTEDPRCAVDRDTIHRRIKRWGWPPERAISQPPGKKGLNRDGEVILKNHPKYKLTAFGETKTLMEWANDPRGSASYQLIHQRLSTGWPPEEAISFPPGKKQTAFVSPSKKNAKRITAWGETKAVGEWAKDARFKARDEGQIYQRLRLGWTPEEAISLPPLGMGQPAPGRPRPKHYGKSYEAFGESKPIAQWAEDPRCAVDYYCLHRRLTQGWNVEEALTRERKHGLKRSA